MGARQPCEIIAEVGVNHNGSLDEAHRLIDAAADAGATVVKFQTFVANRLARPHTEKVPYQERDIGTSSHFEMLQRLELPISSLAGLRDHCEQRNVEFMSTPYGVEDATELVAVGVKRFKVASADVVDLQLHSFLASLGHPVLASTGMASVKEIESMVSEYEDGRSPLTLLHTTSEYPTTASSTNLVRIEALRDFGMPVGFSDHTLGPQAAVMAVAMGVTVLEKHFTLDRSAAGPDHFCSAEPNEFRDYVAAIREAEQRLGSRRFSPTEKETQMARVSRKSLHLRHGLSAGTLVSEGDLMLSRPGTGLHWGQRDVIVGHVLKQNRPEGWMLSREDVEPK